MVTVDASDLALAVAQEGATVVIAAGPETRSRAGVLASEVDAAGGRAAVFTGDPATAEGRAALIEMLDELFA